MRQVGNHLKPMNIGDVLDYSVEAFKQNFKGIVLLSLVLYIPWTVFYSIITNVFLDNNLTDIFNIYRNLFKGVYSPEMAERYLSDSPFINSTLASLLGMLQMVYSITFKLVLNAAVIKMIYDYVISGEVKVNSLTDVKTLIKDCFKFMPKMMGNAVIFVLILATAYIVSVSVAVLVVIAPVVVAFTLYLPPVLLAVTVVLLVLFVLLGVLFAVGFFAVKLIFGAHIIVIEDKSISESIRRSFYLTKGKFWHIAFSGVFAFLLYYLFNSLLIGAAMILALVNNTLYIIVDAFSQMCSAIAEPFVLVFITILFINMKIQKEGLDLEIKMRKLIENEKAGDGELVNG